MRVRIIRKPSEDFGAAGSLLVGRIYNLAPAVASALMLEGCAEDYELLTPEEKRERSTQASQLGWTAADRAATWSVVPPKSKR